MLVPPSLVAPSLVAPLLDTVPVVDVSAVAWPLVVTESLVFAAVALVPPAPSTLDVAALVVDGPVVGPPIVLEVASPFDELPQAFAEAKMPKSKTERFIAV